MTLSKKSDGSKVKEIAAATGDYQFRGLDAGDYCITESPAATDYAPTYNAGDNKFAVYTYKFCLTVAANDNINDAHLGMNKVFKAYLSAFDDSKVQNGLLAYSLQTLHCNASFSYTDGGPKVYTFELLSDLMYFYIPANKAVCYYITSTGYEPLCKVQNDNTFDSTGKECLTIDKDSTYHRAAMVKGMKISGLVWDDTTAFDGKLDKTKPFGPLKMTLRKANGTLSDGPTNNVPTYNTGDNKFGVYTSKYCPPTLVTTSFTDAHLGMNKVFKSFLNAFDDSTSKNGLMSEKVADITAYHADFSYTPGGPKVWPFDTTQNSMIYFWIPANKNICFYITVPGFTPLGKVQNDNSFDSEGKYCSVITTDQARHNAAFIKN
ncbi:hypothetical protein SAMD00019534_124730 [Acytostelium subglobosum LB1]|uniref:hypothetical protein n=1 Tax=Acytostelium subglobosum LB1 TaxID=1410327 RepID=UPI00064497BC|nr:hypothetical protein SAMD00019534_124730 [Acytostelium subglobosum LB1]GAM29297.1 hypothetical protein SAMD00019534_124730 [Acytostelium subglobosum LB1]|eukprot:XP_012747724.1 hypothetical protein SAMD00019534_124730 [Acytostelium subglobosum LB1]